MIHDSYFTFDPVSRKLTYVSADDQKIVLVTKGHRSKRLYFKIPKEINGRNVLSDCSISIHYNNVNSKTKEISFDTYRVDDITESNESGMIEFSWEVKGSATKHAGLLKFSLVFSDTDADENEYYLSSIPFVNIIVYEGINNNQTIEEYYPEAITQIFAALDDIDVKFESYLKTSDLYTAIDSALLEAKEDGQFDGKSAYQVWLDTGNEGSETDFLTSLKGETGPQGPQGSKGTKGDSGKDGAKGADGTSVTIESISESTEDGGDNVITFSDGNTLTIKNGNKGKDGASAVGGEVLPTVSTEDNGKVLGVVNGAWTIMTVETRVSADDGNEVAY